MKDVKRSERERRLLNRYDSLSATKHWSTRSVYDRIFEVSRRYCNEYRGPRVRECMSILGKALNERKVSIRHKGQTKLF